MFFALCSTVSIKHLNNKSSMMVLRRSPEPQSYYSIAVHRSLTTTLATRISLDFVVWKWYSYFVSPDLGQNCLQRHLQVKSKTYTVKPVLSGHSKRRPKMFFKTDYPLMQVKSIAECSKGSILQYFWPLSYYFVLRPVFCLFSSGRLRQVLL